MMQEIDDLGDLLEYHHFLNDPKSPPLPFDVWKRERLVMPAGTDVGGQP